MIVQLCGLSGAGKTTLARAAERELAHQQFSAEVLDGDEYRRTLCSELGFSRKDRIENLKRIAFVARQLSKHGIIAIICAINPFEIMRPHIKKSYPHVKTVFVDCSLDTLKARDTKGLYKRAFLPDGHPEKLKNLTGINDAFDVPALPDLYINTDAQTIHECTDLLVQFILANFIFPIRVLQPAPAFNENMGRRLFKR